MAKKKKINVAELTGRRGSAATVAFHEHVARAGGVIPHRGTKRDRTRADQKRNALRISEG